MSVIWAEVASDQLVAVRDYLARTSPMYAEALVGRILLRTEGLANQPFFGAEVEEYADPDIREVYEHPYRIIYRVTGTDVQIVAVIHSARQLPRNLPNEHE